MTPPTWLGTDWLATPYLFWLGKGALLTIGLATSVCVAATLLGTLYAGLQASRKWIVRSSIYAWLNLHRNTPLMVQLFLWYFGFAGLLPATAMEWLNTPHAISLPLGIALAWPSFEIVIAFVALTLYGASFIGGEIQAGIRALPRGQWAAGLALGLTQRQVFVSIVMPQVFNLIRRPLIGQYTAVIKNTSLAMAIGVAELSYTSRQIETETLLAFQTFAVATLLYLGMVLLVQSKSARTATLYDRR